MGLGTVVWSGREQAAIAVTSTPKSGTKTIRRARVMGRSLTWAGEGWQTQTVVRELERRQDLPISTGLAKDRADDGEFGDGDLGQVNGISVGMAIQIENLNGGTIKLAGIDGDDVGILAVGKFNVRANREVAHCLE